MQDAEVELLRDALRRSEARFRDVIERNADAIVVINESGIITFANQQAGVLFGKAISDLVGHPFGFPAVAGTAAELDLVRNGAAVVVEMLVVDSEWDGQPACIATLRDATDRKRAEEAARQLHAEHSARVVADTAARRFRFLAESSSELTSAIDYDSILSLVPRLSISELADWAIVYSVDHGLLQRREAAHRVPESEDALSELRRFPSDSKSYEPVVEAIRTHKPLLVREIEQDFIENHITHSRQRELAAMIGFRSLMIIPLVARGNVLGALSLGSGERSFDERDVDLAQEFGGLAALALDNARLYRDAREANQVKTDFLAVISHDLRTPLNAILGYSDLLAMGIPDPLSDGSAESVSRIRQSASHLIYLIDELLSYARVESHHQEVHPSDAEMQKIMDDVDAVMRPIAQARSLDFRIDICDEPIIVFTDADKLRQILLNLASNAVRYTVKGTISLKVQTEQDAVVISVADTGVGIAEEHMPKIFEPFWQVSGAQRGPATGTGLGLSVVQRLVSLLGGKISVTSQVGVGTTFTTTLPLRQPVTKV